MADSAAATPRPSSALNLQLEGGRGQSVTSVVVTVSNRAGESETHTYEGDAVQGINDRAPTAIPAPELYDVNGQPPTEATVQITLSRGSKIDDSLGIEPERPVE